MFERLTEEQQKLMKMKRCPFCKRHDYWLEGPHGGDCVNLECGHCGGRINHTPILEWDEVIRLPTKSMPQVEFLPPGKKTFMMKVKELLLDRIYCSCGQAHQSHAGWTAQGLFEDVEPPGHVLAWNYIHHNLAPDLCTKEKE